MSLPAQLSEKLLQFYKKGVTGNTWLILNRRGMKCNYGCTVMPTFN